VIPTLGGWQQRQRSVTKHNKKINPTTRKTVSGQLEFGFFTSKSTMTIISISTAIVATALTLILREKKTYPP